MQTQHVEETRRACAGAGALPQTLAWQGAKKCRRKLVLLRDAQEVPRVRCRHVSSMCAPKCCEAVPWNCKKTIARKTVPAGLTVRPVEVGGSSSSRDNGDELEPVSIEEDTVLKSWAWSSNTHICQDRRYHDVTSSFSDLGAACACTCTIDKTPSPKTWMTNKFRQEVSTTDSLVIRVKCLWNEL